MNNPVNWFEIATEDLERAKEFYSKVFQRNFQLIEMPESKMYMFEGEPSNAGSLGAILSDKNNKPSTDGTVIYFECEDCGIEASRVSEAGGQVILPKMGIGEFGFIAQFIDSEGNRIGLHSHK